MKSNKDYNMCHFDTTLYEVAYWYMVKKHIKMTTGNLFWIMEKILRWSEQKNRFEKSNKLKIADGQITINEKYMI